MILFESACLTRRDKIIFNDLNLSIKKNEKVLIQGKSGMGKTTLFKVLLGFESLDRGRATINGLEISKENIKNIRSQIFYLSQDIDLKHEIVQTLLNEIKLACNLEQDQENFENLLQLLDLNTRLLYQNVKELSGGERQRLGLLIGFMLDRPVWLLDEPTSALDDTMKQQVADYILGLDKTIVIISHDDIWKAQSEISSAVDPAMEPTTRPAIRPTIKIVRIS